MPERLGQHFLISRRALEQIIDAAELTSADTVLEVGAGTGFLTEALLAHAGRVIAVEKDSRLVAGLRERFAADIASARLLLISDDIRNFNPSSYKLKANSYKLVANIPYYLTGDFLRQFLTCDDQPSRMVVMLQREVAERIVAKDGKESILSISVKAFGTPRVIARVGAGVFSPPPKVDSAILLIENISRNLFDALACARTTSDVTRRGVGHRMSYGRDRHEDIESKRGPLRMSEFGFNGDAIVAAEKRFFSLVRAGFAHKRKLLASNLKPLMPDAGAALAVLGLNPRVRAENFTLADWHALAERTC